MKKYLFILQFILVFFMLSINPLKAEKIYIDIDKPGIKKLSIAVEGFEKLNEVTDTIKEALEFTEYFKVYGPFPYKEEKFVPSLWKAADVEIVVRAEIRDKIYLNVFTLSTDKPIFTKDYPLQNNENTGYLISSDLYRILTGKDSPFFNRFAFLRKFKNSTGIFISNWNGKKITDTTVRREIISRVVLKGNKIYYSSLHERQWSIEVFDLSTKANREIIKNRALLQLGDVIGDGQILYLQNDGEFSEIKLFDLSGKSKTLCISRWIDSSPRWHSLQLFFVSNRGGSPQIYHSLEGAGVRRITHQGRYNTEPSINHDGSKIAFSSLAGGFQIQILEMSSGMQSQISRDGNNEQPSFCPDGHFLTIMSDRRGKREIFLISSDGLVQKPLTEGYLPYCAK